MIITTESLEFRNNLQEQWIEKYLSSNRRGILHCAPRTGKTRVAIEILKRMDIKTVLISYPDNKIKEGWIENLDKWGWPSCEITFVNISSLEKYINYEFDVYVIDEIHQRSYAQLMHMQKICNYTTYVLGLSGSISKDTEIELRAHLQLNILLTYTIERAVSDGIIADYLIRVYEVELEKEEKKQYNKYTHIINKAKGDTDFLYLQRNRVVQQSLAKRKEIARLLKENSNRRFIAFTGLKEQSENLNVPYFHSSTDEQAYKDFQNGKINQLALANIGSLGVTYSKLDGVILSNFTHNTETFTQTVCRCVVMDYSGKVGEIIIVSSKEKAEQNKLRKSLKNFDKNKIVYEKLSPAFVKSLGLGVIYKANAS